MDDKFWAARRLQGFTAEMLKALTRVGQFNDPASEAALAKFLIDRRSAIVRRYLPAVNPIVDVELSPDNLTFTNAAVDADVAAIPREYVADWMHFDNLTRIATPIGSTRASGDRNTIPVPRNLPSQVGTYVRVEISAIGGPDSWRLPVHAYFVRQHGTWRLVGFERMPGGNAPRRDGNGANE
jgi:hypothetical protein